MENTNAIVVPLTFAIIVFFFPRLITSAREMKLARRRVLRCNMASTQP